MRLLPSFAVLFAFSSCINFGICTEGEGELVTQTLEVEDFHAVDLSSSFTVIVKQGPFQRVEVSGHPNIIERLETDVSRKTLELELEDGCYRDYKLTVTLTVPELKRAEVSGSGTLRIEDFDEAHGELSLEIGGSGDIVLGEMPGLQYLEASIDGSGDVELTGKYQLEEMRTHIHGSGSVEVKNRASATLLDISINGSGDFEGFRLTSEATKIRVNGSGDVECTTTEELNVAINGSGDVHYRGNPTISQSVNGSGDLIHKGGE